MALHDQKRVVVTQPQILGAVLIRVLPVIRERVHQPLAIVVVIDRLVTARHNHFPPIDVKDSTPTNSAIQNMKHHSTRSNARLA